MKKNHVWFLLLAASFSVMAQAQPDNSKPPTAQTSASASNSLLNLPNDLSALEASGIYSMDNVAATSLLYATRNFKDTKGAGENLLEEFLAYHQLAPTPEKAKLRATMRKCNEIYETFAKKDCAAKLMDDYSAYGQKVSKARYLNFVTSSITTWEEVPKTIKVRNINYLGAANVDRSCMANSVCLAVGEYGSGKFMLCYQLDAPLPLGVEIPSSEEKARAIVKLSGPEGFAFIQPSFLLQVTEPVKALPVERMCDGGSRSKILAVGKAKLKHMVLWGPQQSVYVHNFEPTPGLAGATPLTQSKTQGQVTPLELVKQQTASTSAPLPESGKVKLQTK
jgi:hypothetical protein